MGWWGVGVRGRVFSNGFVESGLIGRNAHFCFDCLGHRTGECPCPRRTCVRVRDRVRVKVVVSVSVRISARVRVRVRVKVRFRV